MGPQKGSIHFPLRGWTWTDAAALSWPWHLTASTIFLSGDGNRRGMVRLSAQHKLVTLEYVDKTGFITRVIEWALNEDREVVMVMMLLFWRDDAEWHEETEKGLMVLRSWYQQADNIDKDSKKALYQSPVFWCSPVLPQTWCFYAVAVRGVQGAEWEERLSKGSLFKMWGWIFRGNVTWNTDSFNPN